MQHEIKKKTGLYAMAAVLFAIVLVSTVYVYGSAPIVFPPSQSPMVTGMKTFSSSQEIADYLNTNSNGYPSYIGAPLDDQFFGVSAVPTAPPKPVSQSSGSFGSGDAKTPNEYWARPQQDLGHSTTNIQVSGVDEADTVKTDGSYIYTTSSAQNSVFWIASSSPKNTDNSVYVVNADPQNAQVESKIVLGNNTEPAGLFLSSDGNKLTVIASKYETYQSSSRWEDDNAAPMIMPSYQSDVYTFINVYDVSDKADPVLTRNLTLSGSYFNSRMIGDNVYAVVSQTAYVYRGVVSLPAVYEGKNVYDASPQTIYYADNNDTSYSFTSFYGFNIKDDVSQPTNMTVLMGGASTMYVSPNNIYVTYPDWDQNVGQYTSVYRVAINGLDLSLQASGSVPGSILNQYAMDEYGGYFRVATNWYSETQISNVYVLKQDLTVEGKLEGLAPNENLHSVRFMGDKCYLVTFKKTDPLFVIDLSQPNNPSVLGQLKIPGYSDYLHPYDESHLIGVGKEAVEAQEGDFAWYQGVKLALFDVSNVANPQQLSNYVIGDRGTDSAALNDPKAFLFDREKGLLVIPVSLAVVPEAQKQQGASAYGQTMWQGAYVFSVSLDGGFTLKGTVTHLDGALLNSQGYLKDSSEYYSTQNQWITRALYIGNTLYTVSNGEVKLNSLTDLSPIASVTLA